MSVRDNLDVLTEWVFAFISIRNGKTAPIKVVSTVVCRKTGGVRSTRFLTCPQWGKRISLLDRLTDWLTALSTRELGYSVIFKPLVSLVPVVEQAVATESKTYMHVCVITGDRCVMCGTCTMNSFFLSLYLFWFAPILALFLRQANRGRSVAILRREKKRTKKV